MDPELRKDESIMETMRVYSRQHENSIYELYNHGVVTNKEIYVRLHMAQDADFFIQQYRTFVAMAETLLPRPEGIEFPIWTSIDLKGARHPEPNSVLYAIDVPKDQIIIFDGMKWDYVLNLLYLPQDERDKQVYLKEIKQLGIDNEFFLSDPHNQGRYPAIETKIKDSWMRIFEIEDSHPMHLQGNLWQIQHDWVKGVIHYGEPVIEPDPAMFDLAQEVDRVRASQAARQGENS